MLKIIAFAFLIFSQLSIANKNCTESISYTVTSKRQSDRPENRGKIFKLKDHPKGILINARFFPDFELKHLKKAGVPVGILNPKQPPKGRLILLHGLGYDISTIFSLMVPALTLHNILEGKTNDSYAKWFNENFPEYQFPLQIVVVDVPPMGWAQPLDNFSNMLELSNYFRLIKAELDSELPLKNFYISRSASAKMALIAGQDDAGVVITGGTYPHPEVVHANIEEIKRLEKEENQLPNWPIIHQFSKMILDPVFHFELEVATSKNTPVLSLIGGNDAETPELAQKLWKELLKVSEENPHRSQFIIEGAGHQVFKRPEKLGPEISDKDPEIKAYQLLFSFLKKYL